jgi:hypothetical protein
MERAAEIKPTTRSMTRPIQTRERVRSEYARRLKKGMSSVATAEASSSWESAVLITAATTAVSRRPATRGWKKEVEVIR